MDNPPSDGESTKDYATRRVSLEESEALELPASPEQDISPKPQDSEEVLMNQATEPETPAEAAAGPSAATKPIETEIPPASPALETVVISKTASDTLSSKGEKKDKNQSVVIAVVIAISVVLLACICACTAIAIVFVSNASW